MKIAEQIAYHQNVANTSLLLVNSMEIQSRVTGKYDGAVAAQLIEEAQAHMADAKALYMRAMKEGEKDHVPVMGKIDFNSRVSALPLTVRTVNVLRNHGIHYIGNLVQLSEEDHRRIPYMDRAGVDELKDVMLAYGLHSSTDVGNWTAPTLAKKA